MKFSLVFSLFSLFLVYSCAESNNVKDSGESECGNYQVETGEECDDGNDLYGDGCDPQCQIQAGWECDGSPSECTLLCGNGVLDPDEQCDDGSRQNGDGCDAQCQIQAGWECEGEPSECTPLCGNGVVDENEQCDGTDLQGNTCESIEGGFTGGDLSCNSGCVFDTTSCILPNCGDGILNEGEQCDDGNNSNNDSCLNNCQNASCGDGYHWVGTEECDDGNSSNVDNCTNECMNASCGDGYTWEGMEECDDGNTTQGDGCNHLCQHESLPQLHTIDTVFGGWFQQTIFYAGDPHAPQLPILAAANVESQNKAYVFTESTYHIISLPSRQWIGHGQLSPDFPGVPGSAITSAHGVSWDYDTQSNLVLIAGEYAYSYFLHNTTQVITPSGDNPILIDWSNKGDPHPQPEDITSRYLALENDDGWVTVDPLQLCGVGSSTTGPYGASITSGLSLYIRESGYCFEWCEMMPVSSFPPFSISGAPAPDKIRAMFYVTPKLYVISNP